MKLIRFALALCFAGLAFGTSLSYSTTSAYFNDDSGDSLVLSGASGTVHLGSKPVTIPLWNYSYTTGTPPQLPSQFGNPVTITLGLASTTVTLILTVDNQANLSIVQVEPSRRVWLFALPNGKVAQISIEPFAPFTLANQPYIGLQPAGTFYGELRIYQGQEGDDAGC